MKNTLLLLSLIFLVDFAFGQGDAPPMLQGQNQTSKTVAPLIKLPASQVTKVTGGALIETGNKNILEDPSFEAAVRPTSWVVTSGSLTVESTVVIDGKKSVVSVFSSSTTVTQDSTLYSAQFADGPQGLAMVRVKTSQPGVKLCSRQANVTSTSNCMTHSGSGKWELLKVPFILGGTSNGISIAGSSGTSGNVYIDDAFVGPADLKVDTNLISGVQTFTPSVNGFGTIANAYGELTQRGDKAFVRFKFDSGTPTAASAYITLPFGLKIKNYNDTNPEAVGVYSRGVTSEGSAGKMLRNWGNGDNIIFFGNPQSMSTGGGNPLAIAQANLSFGSGQTFSGEFEVTIAGWGTSTAVYSSTNKDTDWASYTPSYNGSIGTGGNATLNGKWKRSSGDMEITISMKNGSTGVSTPSEMAFGIPSGYTIDDSKLSGLPSTQGTVTAVGTAYARDSGVADYVGTVLYNTPNSGIVSIGSHSNANHWGSATNAPFTWGTDDNLTIKFKVPIKGWENSNVIVGSFDGLEKCADSYECEDTYSGKVSVSGVVSDENLDNITGNCSVSTATYTCTFKSSLYTVAPNCTITPEIQTTDIRIGLKTATATTLTVQFWNTANSAQPVAFSYNCQKTGADYHGKTAKAVASDANIRSIGATGVDIQSVLFGSGANCDTACSTGTCSICTQIGSKITSVTFNATGQYKLNGIDGTKYNCTGSGGGANFVPAQHSKSSSTSSYAFINTGSGASNVNAATVSVMCIGVP